MWDEEDGFFYDLLRLPDGRAARLKVRSMVGLLPLCATSIIPQEFITRFPKVVEQAREFLMRDPSLVANIAPPNKSGVAGRRLLAILNEDKLRRVLTRMLDEDRFLSPYGIRSLSRITSIIPMSSMCTAKSTECNICRQNPTPECLAGTRIGEVPSGCRSTS